MNAKTCEHNEPDHVGRRTTCGEMFNCCSCGGHDCGCRYCWDCNACGACRADEDEDEEDSNA